MQGKYMDKFPKGWFRSYDIGPGWLAIVDGTLDEIFEIDPGVEIHQIKEKFGGLRIYIGTTAGLPMDKYDEISALIRRAEDNAANTCESCGGIGHTTNIGGWLKTLCEPCKVKEIERKENMFKA